MPTPKEQRDDEHEDLLNYELCPLDYPYTLDCYLLPLADNSVNLHHAYIGDEDIFDLLSDRVINDLQRQAEKLWDKERDEARNEYAIDRANGYTNVFFGALNRMGGL